ncbi:MAG: TetR/AcrR family transcriptional regulator [Novosphingobium sp.]|nr:TetR/AcrR family transcriptional regulator [Novosphingobium sp.]
MVTNARLPRSAPDARREDIVSKASELFLNEGFAATSMSTIARAVGGSKATLYKYFPTKEALFEAVMEQRSAAVLGPIHSADIPRETPRIFLTAVGERLLAGIYGPEAIAINRVVVGDCVRSPEIGRVFFEMGPDRGKVGVAGQLAIFAKAGSLNLNDPLQGTEDFFALLRGEAHFRVMAGVSAAPDEDEIRRHVRRVVDLLLKLWSPGNA